VKLHHLVSPGTSWMMAAVQVMAYPLRLGEGLGWRLTYVTDGGDRARNGVLAGGGGERVVNKWGALGG